MTSPAFFISTTRPPPTSTLLPYTTLFRSTSSHAFAAPPAPSSTQAWLKKLPASTSACVTVRPEEHMTEPQATIHVACRVVLHTRIGAFGSVTSTLCNVTFPLLLATTV